MNKRKSFLLALTVLIILGIMPNCKKKKDDTCSSQPAIVATTSPAVNTVEAPGPGPTFALRVTITSTLPSGGVTIEVKARPEASATTFYSESKTATTSVTDFTITNTPQNVPSIVEITITSKSCSSNKWTGSYRYSRK
ncbi:MAG TPA: hypothetical protein VM012_01715 [Flavitalea sp.]|nr:hypothetical protein [Flavitalea sp.]